MKAVQISRFGGPEVLKPVELPTPKPGSGQILARIRAIGVNLADALTRRDRYAVTPPLPAILGTEAAGVVEALGADVHGFAIGQRVGVPLFAANSLGAYATSKVTFRCLSANDPELHRPNAQRGDTRQPLRAELP